MDPFQMALDAMFYAPGSVEASLTLPGEQPLIVRGIPSRPSEELDLGQGAIVADTFTIMLRRSEVAQPHGGALTIGDESFSITGEPRIDVEGITWTCELEPA